jgi:hypothetical protein
MRPKPMVEMGPILYSRWALAVKKQQLEELWNNGQAPWKV